MRTRITALAAFLLQGCAAAGVGVATAGAGAAMSAGVEHTMSGTAIKTFANPVDAVHGAALAALKRMDMTVTGDAVTQEGRHMTATALQRSIAIDLEKVSANATRMRVEVSKGDIFFKDSATGSEIILQTLQSLDARKAAADAARK